MKISELIYILGEAKATYGDLEICTFDGSIQSVSLQASTDGVIAPSKEPNEIVMEVRSA